MSLERGSDYATEIMDLVAKHFEMSDHGKGKYQSRYMEPAKVEALLKDLWAYFQKVHDQSKLLGQKEMLVGLSELFTELTKSKQNELNLGETESQTIKSYFKWDRSR